MGRDKMKGEETRIDETTRKETRKDERDEKR